MMVATQSAADSTDEAIEHQAVSVWEKGVQKERDGSMTDAIKYYRQALKIDEKVEKTYRKKLHAEWQLQKELAELRISNTATAQATATEMVNTDDDLEDEPEMLPCWILEMLPDDLVLRVIRQVVISSGESWLNLSLTCKRFNALCFHNSAPFRVFASHTYQRQFYDSTSVDCEDMSDLEMLLEEDFWDQDCEKILRKRPYIKFEGVYISIVNYLRHGVNAEGSSSLISPIQMITYYRYFRFYADGRCLRLVTTDEPSQVVNRFSKEDPPRHSEICYWGLGVNSTFNHIYIRRAGEKYSFVEELQIKSHGRKRHHRLTWVNSLVIDKQGNVSECCLRNEKPFNFSRVRSFAIDS